MIAIETIVETLLGCYEQPADALKSARETAAMHRDRAATMIHQNQITTRAIAEIHDHEEWAKDYEGAATAIEALIAPVCNLCAGVGRVGDDLPCPNGCPIVEPSQETSV
jgi:hypothetical protein